MPLALPLLPLLVRGRPAFEFGAEAVVVIGDGAESLVPAERHKRVHVIGIRWRRQWRWPSGAAGEVVESLKEC